ncbi:MAG: tRNA (N6-threonylcarbamoyladenosine(37)-N6)-methyltransferase TrmO [Bacteroidales bacterium]|nr:tRNA (N6-threonylcarbamoyladenosine(37)-N6)-methyltransferase TrmO [Bacteroidales bacterium]
MSNIQPIAFFRSPLPQKFGLPRQSGLVESLEGRIEFEPKYRTPDALRGLDGFDYIWLIWGFNLNPSSEFSPTVRPPRLGGNERVGVFASRSPFRPNGLGLSSVKVLGIDWERCEIIVAGADLADGTPIYDIKPYVAYCDSHPGARSGFADAREWQRLEVRVASPELESALLKALGEHPLRALLGVLAEDPRPQYHDDPAKEYGLSFGGYNVRFKVKGTVLIVLAISPEPQDPS